MKKNMYVHLSCSYKKKEYGTITFYLLPSISICKDNIGDNDEDISVSAGWLFWHITAVIC